MFWAALISRDVRQIDFSLGARGKFNFGFLRSLLQALHSQRVAPKIHALIFLEFISQVIDQATVKVLTTKEGVAVG